MTYLDAWKALASRILGLGAVAQLHAQYLLISRSDTYGRWRRLRDQAEQIFTSVRAFHADFGHTLPPAAITAIERFLAEDVVFFNNTGTTESSQEQSWMAVVAAGALETQLSYLLRDSQASIRMLSERAFAHLQRSIAADEALRDKWQLAFEAGETTLEKLGAVHLLSHGILAFKADTLGARTDLVYQVPLDVGAAREFSAGLVLTEWKRAEHESEAGMRFKEARQQAHLYAHGALAGVELTSYRYAVVVSKPQIDVPQDITLDGVLYRHINIAVAPNTPSRAAKRTKR